MDILPSVEYKFDTFLTDQHKIQLENAARELESIDDHLWKKMPKNLYKIIRKDKRTIVTSLGEITFKRRYIQNTSTKEYFYPLDVKMEIPSRKRLSNELRLRILQEACDLAYSKVGEIVAYGVKLSKSTICRCIKNSSIHVDMLKPFISNGIIHVQIDEKFVSRTDSKNKTRHYTATIFDGNEIIRNRTKLLHRQIVSAEDLSCLRKQIKKVLIHKFLVTPFTQIFVSGDLAKYIQCFADDIDYCCATYVPDKFHCCRFLADELGLIGIANPKDVIKYVQEIDKNKQVVFVTDNFKKVYNLYRRNRHIFEPWFDKSYLGCSQEGMNSHYYAPRFGKQAARFNSETIDKLCHIKEAILNRWRVEVKNPDYRIYKIKIKETKSIEYIPTYERSIAYSNTAGKFHEELDKWLEPLIIY